MLYLFKKIFYWSIVDLWWEATPSDPDLDFVRYGPGGDEMSAATCGRQKGEAWVFLKKMPLNRWGPAWGWEEQVCYLRCRRINSTSGLWLFPLNPPIPCKLLSSSGWVGMSLYRIAGSWDPGCCEMAHVLGSPDTPPTTPMECHCRAVPSLCRVWSRSSSHGPRLSRAQGLAPAWEAMDDLFSFSDISSASSPLVCVGLGWGWGKDD